MKARDFLLQYKDAKSDYENKLLELQELLEMDVSISSLELSGVKLTAKSDRVGNIITRIEDKEVELKYQTIHLLDIMDEVTGVIDQVKDCVYRRLLYLRYIESRSWEDIAKSLQYERRHCFRLHDKALKEVEELIG